MAFSLRISSMSVANGVFLSKSAISVAALLALEAVSLLFPQESLDEYVNTNRKIENTSRKNMFSVFRLIAFFMQEHLHRSTPHWPHPAHF